MVPALSYEISRVSHYSGFYLPLLSFHIPDFHRLWYAFPNISTRIVNGLSQSEPHQYFYLWFGLFLFRSPLLQESFVYFLFLWVLRCFSSPRSLLTYYFTHMQILEFFSSSEFPHSDIYDSLDICSSSQLFAAYHVLLRLLVPRHSPYALCSLTFNLLASSKLRIAVSSFDKNLLDVQTYYLGDFFLLSLHCSFILCNIFDLFILSLFSVSLLTNSQCLTLPLCLLLVFLVYLFISIYFSMCYLASSKLRITASNFEKILSMYNEYYFDNFFSFSLYYSFILCHFQLQLN